MRKFILDSIGFAILVITLYAIVALALHRKQKVDQSNSYMAEMIDKHKRLNEIKGKKIIFAGGSNLAFGLNSEEVEKAFSIPVVNLGLHAGLGLDFILNEAADAMKSGDVVFLSIEYFLDNEGTYELKKNTSELFKDSRKYYKYHLKQEISSNLDQTRNHIKTFIAVKRKVPNTEPKKKNISYTRAAFNKYGDHTGHIGWPSKNPLADRGILNYQKWGAIDGLNKFQKMARARNVNVFFLYPNYPESEYKKNKQVIERLAVDIKHYLKMDTANEPDDFVFPDSLFYDTVYHLSGQGRDLRTKKLIEVLRNHSNIQDLFSIMRSKS